MKIKVKKEMRLDELIKWARENPELSKGKKFYETDESVRAVYFQKNTNKFFTIGVLRRLTQLLKSKLKRKSQKKR